LCGRDTGYVPSLTDNRNIAPFSCWREVGVGSRMKRASLAGPHSALRATLSLRRRRELLPALASNREPHSFLGGAEQGARLRGAFVLLGDGGGIVDDAGARLNVHQAVFHD
jgi:hypothetical protein